MGTVLFIIFAVLVLVNMSNKSEDDKKKKRKKKKRSSWGGKSDWEKTCDDGGKFFNW